MILHVFAQSGDELEPLFKEQLCERSGNVAAIPKQLALQVFDQVRHRSAIIHIAWGQAASQQFPSVIDGQMQLKAVKPSHAGLATPGIGGKDAMQADPFGITDFQRSRVNEADARASSHLDFASRPASEP